MALNDSSFEGSHNIFDELLKYTINFIFQILASNSRVGHRNRINIFDVVKMICSLNISHSELRSYLNWLRLKNDSSDFSHFIFAKKHILASKNCKIDLAFCVDVNEAKKPGFDFLPPTPSSFTFKSTPVINEIC